MLKLIWIVATIAAQGPVMGEIENPTKFETEAACNEFGDRMTSRMEDWMRGAVRAGWDHPVTVGYRCEMDGKPA